MIRLWKLLNNMTKYNFVLNPAEEQRYEEFCRKHNRCSLDTAIGGQFEITFTPTSIADAVSVRCITCNEKENITDYDSW